jgi:hypothetical protein
MPRSGSTAAPREFESTRRVLFAYSEAKRERPRGVVGFFDIAQSMRVDRELLSFTAAVVALPRDADQRRRQLPRDGRPARAG